VTGRVYGSLRDALHATATGARVPMKALAAELDWSPSELSMRTTLGGDNGRAFPADDEHLIKLQRVTEDVSVLYTMAELLGFEVVPKRERTAELLVQVQRDLRELMPRIQMVLNIGVEPPGKGAKR